MRPACRGTPQAGRSRFASIGLHSATTLKLRWGTGLRGFACPVVAERATEMGGATSATQLLSRKCVNGAVIPRNAKGLQGIGRMHTLITYSLRWILIEPD